jgi:hypothetical protein
MKRLNTIKYFLLIALVLFFINIGVKAIERPSSISVDRVANSDKWTGRATSSNADCKLNSLCPEPMSATINSNRTYVYSLQQLKNTSIGSNLNNPVELMSVLNNKVPDYGLIYLMNQASYTSDNSNRDGYKKVQAAIWLYVYYHRGEVVNDPTPQSTGTNVGYIFGTTNTPNVDNVYLNASNARTAMDLYNHAVSED